MPVNRSYIVQFAGDPDTNNLYQALTQLANFADGLEAATGVVVGQTGQSTQSAAPPTATWMITAANGHFLIQITNPSTATAILQHQVRSAVNQNFDANSSTTVYTLGYGQTTLDVIDPNDTKYWQLQSRYQGSAWNAWLTYSTASGVVALNAGNLVTT